MARTTLSTSDERRAHVVDAAIVAFARGGYLGTTVADVARHAGISPAYVFKLHASKEAVFVAALDRCFDLVVAALEAGVASSSGHAPEDVLDAMGGAYAELIADRDLLMLQVHAQSAADVSEIRAALRRGYERVTEFARSRSGATPEQVQRFIAFGQLCHLVATLDLDESQGGWQQVIAAGIRHPEASGAH